MVGASTAVGMAGLCVQVFSANWQALGRQWTRVHAAAMAPPSETRAPLVFGPVRFQWDERACAGSLTTAACAGGGSAHTFDEHLVTAAHRRALALAAMAEFRCLVDRSAAEGVVAVDAEGLVRAATANIAAKKATHAPWLSPELLQAMIAALPEPAALAAELRDRKRPAPRRAGNAGAGRLDGPGAAEESATPVCIEDLD